MSAEQHQALLAEAGERFGPYDPRRWQLEQRIEQLGEAAASAPEPTDAPSDEDSQGGESA